MRVAALLRPPLRSRHLVWLPAALHAVSTAGPLLRGHLVTGMHSKLATMMKLSLDRRLLLLRKREPQSESGYLSPMQTRPALPNGLVMVEGRASCGTLLLNRRLLC